MLGKQGGLAREKWPQYRDELAREEQFEVIIQINGRAARQRSWWKTV